uniref:Uncharacterized protein n=1 Tax=Vespula pensylvanica TaxID=30213 RepID=A0A834PFX3_VESPE|nr:hypothetical protein H0235_001433 [Vespula pensylvanica]
MGGAKELEAEGANLTEKQKVAIKKWYLKEHSFLIPSFPSSEYYSLRSVRGIVLLMYCTKDGGIRRKKER